VKLVGKKGKGLIGNKVQLAKKGRFGERVKFIGKKV